MYDSKAMVEGNDKSAAEIDKVVSIQHMTLTPKAVVGILANNAITVFSLKCNIFFPA